MKGYGPLLFDEIILFADDFIGGARFSFDPVQFLSDILVSFRLYKFQVIDRAVNHTELGVQFVTHTAGHLSENRQLFPADKFLLSIA
jgi:hypothetical protein